MYQIIPYIPKPSWNKDKLVGQKLPLKLEEVWSIRTSLDISNNLRELVKAAVISKAVVKPIKEVAIRRHLNKEPGSKRHNQKRLLWQSRILTLMITSHSSSYLRQLFVNYHSASQ